MNKFPPRVPASPRPRVSFTLSPFNLPPFAILCLALLAAACAFAGRGEAAKGLSRNDARKLILSLPGVRLNKSAVRVREVTTTGASAEASADVRTAFRFEKGRVDESGRKVEEDRWFAVEVRVGDRQWEDLELLTRALGLRERPRLLSTVESLLVDFEARERARREREGREQPGAVGGADAGKNEKKKGKKKKGEENAPGPEEAELRRDGVLFKEFSPLLSSATVEAEVETAFRFTQEGGRWRVSELRVGAGPWQNVAALAAALDAEKNARARADLETVRTALEAFRRERGFYVVAEDETTLVDHLSPRYLTRVVRVDPWHRPYKYTGTRDAYTLTSDGPDGKPGTPDDVRLESGR